MATTPPKITLETLPPEIRRHVLFTLDLDSLSALIHASPVFHQQYLLDRHPILCQSLQSTLRSATPEACAVHRADVVGALEADDSTRAAATTAFLDSWSRRAWSAAYSIRDENLILDEAVSMAVFHLSVVKPIMERASNWFLANLAKETGTPADSGPTLLSSTEQTRLLRALYRFQLAAIVFGNGSRTKAPPRDWGHRVSLHLADLLTPLAPWEIEEIGCAFAFAGSVYSPILDVVEKETDPDGPRFVSEGRPNGPRFVSEGRPTNPDDVYGVFDLRRDYIRSALHQGLISRGLSALLSFLPPPPSHPLLLSTIQTALCWPASFTLRSELSVTGQVGRLARSGGGAADPQVEQRREGLPFRGDCVDDNGDGKARPPMAWTLFWHGAYSGWYGGYMPEGLVKWGYVLWDAGRVEGGGARAVVEREWREKYYRADGNGNGEM